MRVGIEINWEVIGHGEAAATATASIYTENQFSYSDDQTLNFGGVLNGSKGFSNSAGGAPVLRATKTYDYNYGANEYGASPGSKTFTARLSGAFNGVTPSKSLASDIPGRPYAAPAAPTNASASRVSDASTKVAWTNRSTSGEPWNFVILQRSLTGGTWTTISTSISGSASSYTYASQVNQKLRLRVAAYNSYGTSAYDETLDIYTIPSAPTAPLRTGANGASQSISWSSVSIGYAEYSTEVWRATNGTWALIATVSAVGGSPHIDTYPATNPSDRFRYRVRHKTTAGGQGVLYSAFSAETTETSGQTAPPLASTNLQPSGLTVDPTLPMRLSWTFQPGMAGDTQDAYTVKHRPAGAATWTEITAASLNQFYDLAANTYSEQVTVEWTVVTSGADPVLSPEPTPVTFTTAVAAISPDPVKLPVVMDLFTGQLEASSTAHEIRDLVSRFQSKLIGGGIRTVDATYNVSWSQRFIAIALGRSKGAFRQGWHEIKNPHGWNVTNKVLTSNRATLTLNVSTYGQKLRVGDKLSVTGVGAPFDSTLGSEWTVREVTTSTVTYDVVAANVVSVAATGAAFPTIQGHCGAANVIPSNIEVPLTAWTALYYDLPLGWGSGTTPRKNGVVKVANTVLTTNLATLTVLAPHYFTVGDRITVSGCGAPYDGDGLVVTGLTPTTISAQITSANVASANPPSGLAIPSGYDTFFSNFHVVNYTGADFVVPSNWILIALRNFDSSSVEWGTGDSVDPGFDSDSPVFKQVVLTSTSDVSTAAGNKPALRVGSVAAGHMRLDGDEIQSMVNDNTPGTLSLNAGGGTVYIGTPTGSTVLYSDSTSLPNHSTTTSVANCHIAVNGRIYRNSSTKRFKRRIRDARLDPSILLKLVPRKFRSTLESDDPNKDYLGFVAEEAQELGLDPFVEFDDEGTVMGFQYPLWVVALQAIARDQQDQIKSLEERIQALETR